MPYSPAGILANLSSSPLRNIAAAIIGGAISGTLEYLVHTTVLEVHLPVGVPAIVDSTMVTVFTALFLFLVLREWRLRRAMVLEQLRMVAELNHNVRNALQRLAYSQYLPPHEQTEAVLESVNRIDSTLRELFPVVGGRRGAVPDHVRAREKQPQDRRQVS